MRRPAMSCQISSLALGAIFLAFPKCAWAQGEIEEGIRVSLSSSDETFNKTPSNAPIEKEDTVKHLNKSIGSFFAESLPFWNFDPGKPAVHCNITFLNGLNKIAFNCRPSRLLPGAFPLSEPWKEPITIPLGERGELGEATWTARLKEAVDLLLSHHHEELKEKFKKVPIAASGDYLAGSANDGRIGTYSVLLFRTERVRESPQNHCFEVLPIKGTGVYPTHGADFAFPDQNQRQWRISLAVLRNSTCGQTSNVTPSKLNLVWWSGDASSRTNTSRTHEAPSAAAR
jgi:hypothetical protein